MFIVSRILSFITLLLLVPIVLTAQTTFEAYTDVQQVIAGEYFDIHFILRNADGDQFTPPKFQNFRVVRGPSRSISRSIIQGQRSSETTYSYILEALKPGVFTINYATIRVGKETLRSNTVQLSVSERKEVPLDSLFSDEPIFIRAIPSMSTAYPGQQVIIDYKLYSSINVENYSIAGESDYQGFFAQPLRRYRGKTQQEVIGDKTYATIVFRRVAIYPQLVGEVVISPLRLKVGIEDSRQQSGFLLLNPVKILTLQTQPITVDVLPLPATVPPTFCGGVGMHELRMAYDQTNLSTDDALTVQLNITGPGDVKRLEPPVWLESDSFEVYNPTTIEEETAENQGSILSRKTFEYQILPKYPGSFTLIPAISYFDPDSLVYKTITSDTIRLLVTQGSGIPRNNPNVSQDSTETIAVLRPLKSRVPLHPHQDGTAFSNGWMFAVPAPILLLLGFGYRRFRQQKAAVDPAEMRRKKAMQIATQRLVKAKSFLEKQDNRGFFDEVSKATLGFLSDRTGIPPAQQNKSLIRSALVEKGIPEALIERLLALLHQSELALFAGQANEAARTEVYEEALQVLSLIANQVD